MAYKIAGGSKWWQVRAGPGVEAEWIVMKKDWKKDPAAKSGTSTPVGGKKGKHRSGSGSEKGKGHDDEGMVGEDGGVDGSGECELVGPIDNSSQQSARRWMSCVACSTVGHVLLLS